ncbi:DNA polymerase III subunit chi [Xylophilus sp.]|uniref:DNA polymerase III subunit chi n=1 Tax=Xylophilus sp. TaxID=2653893 RepID=UPI0013B99F93|nr:DNA polymerase III subunit chi [Xylophilus sp.]KAF1049596.1 MAG: hypothetical protein GAK38_00695 [Xylophilus sp.]
MTEIAFHFNAPDKLAYVCRLLRKAVGSGARVVVTAAPPLLDGLDSALWSITPQDFIAHCRAADSDAVMLRASPVVLAESADAQLPEAGVLVNLGAGVPEGFSRFGRLIEVVGRGEADRQQARQRWRHYAERGYHIVRHDLVLKPA